MPDSLPPASFNRKTSVPTVLKCDTVTCRTAGFPTRLQTAALKKGVRLPLNLAEVLLDELAVAIADELKAGRHVNVRGLGTFKLVVRNRKAGGRVLRVKLAVAAALKKEIADARV